MHEVVVFYSIQLHIFSWKDKQLRQAPCCWKKWISQDQTKKLFQLYLANSHKSTSPKHHHHHHCPFHAAKLPAVISEGSPFGQRCTSSVVQALKKKSLPGWCSWSIFGQLSFFCWFWLVVFHRKKISRIKLNDTEQGPLSTWSHMSLLKGLGYNMSSKPKKSNL